jgi:hypothetical protein
MRPPPLSTGLGAETRFTYSLPPPTAASSGTHWSCTLCNAQSPLSRQFIRFRNAFQSRLLIRPCGNNHNGVSPHPQQHRSPDSDRSTRKRKVAFNRIGLLCRSMNASIWHLPTPLLAADLLAVSGTTNPERRNCRPKWTIAADRGGCIVRLRSDCSARGRETWAKMASKTAETSRSSIHDWISSSVGTNFNRFHSGTKI